MSGERNKPGCGTVFSLAIVVLLVVRGADTGSPVSWGLAIGLLTCLVARWSSWRYSTRLDALFCLAISGLSIHTMATAGPSLWSFLMMVLFAWLALHLWQRPVPSIFPTDEMQSTRSSPAAAAPESAAPTAAGPAIVAIPRSSLTVRPPAHVPPAVPLKPAGGYLVESFPDAIRRLVAERLLAGATVRFGQVATLGQHAIPLAVVITAAGAPATIVYRQTQPWAVDELARWSALAAGTRPGGPWPGADIILVAPEIVPPLQPQPGQWIPLA